MQTSKRLATASDAHRYLWTKTLLAASLKSWPADGGLRRNTKGVVISTAEISGYSDDSVSAAAASSRYANRNVTITT